MIPLRAEVCLLANIATWRAAMAASVCWPADRQADDAAWTIRYLVVNTSDWWLGHQMLVAAPWITDIDWLDGTVSVDLTRQAIKDAPPYDAKALPNPEQERGPFEHYGHADEGHLIAKLPFG
jgi:hypothetical protein